MPKFIPKPEEQPDGSYIFRLRDEVVLSLQAHSETKVKAQLWRKDQLLPPDTGSLVSKSFRDKLVKAARDGFGETNVPNVEEDIGAVATLLGARGSDGKSIEEKLQHEEGPSLLEKLIAFAEQHADF